MAILNRIHFAVSVLIVVLQSSCYHAFVMPSITTRTTRILFWHESASVSSTPFQTTQLFATNSKLQKIKSSKSKKKTSNGVGKSNNNGGGGSNNNGSKTMTTTTTAKTFSKGGTGGRPIGPGRSLSEEELQLHVSTRYIQGPGGPLHYKKRGGGGVLSQSVFANDDTDVDHDLTTTTTTTTTAASTSSAFENDDESSYVQQQYLRELNNRPALVLNADYLPLSYLPLSLWSWQDAVKAVFCGKVTVVDVYPDISVRTASIEVPLPSIIALTDYVQPKNQKPAFTRRNVFLRDEYRCQYCDQRFHTADLSLDHVIPRSAGGVLSWDNAVTSCLKCNGRKGSKSVSELKSVGMRLLRQPKCPTQMDLAARAARMVPKRVHPTWKPFLGIAERPKNVASGSSSNNGGGRGDEEYIDDRYFEVSAEWNTQ